MSRVKRGAESSTNKAIPLKTNRRNVLVVDVGGTSVKVLATGQDEPRKFPSGRKMKPEQMVSGVKEIVGDWKYDVVTIGYPGLVLRGGPAKEPHNLAPGWVGFDFKSAFGCPVKILNDAAMQALGSYKSGLLLFLGLGPASAPPSSMRDIWYRWNWPTFLTRTGRTRISLACAV